MPDTFDAVLEAAQQAAESRPNGDMEHWQRHQDIIEQQFAPLLIRFLKDDDSQVCFSAVQPCHYLQTIHYHDMN